MLLIISIIEVKLYGIQYQPIGSDPDKADKKIKVHGKQSRFTSALQKSILFHDETA
jgi:hypothetical protein